MFETLVETASREAEKYFGKYPGLVEDNAPPEDAAHRGELLVKVPGILEETPDGAGQQPIEVVARPCFVPGFFFLPEIGAQVWVEFVAGDINSPLWTGVWYPTDKAPQTAGAEAPTEFQKVIRTTSGHAVELDDDGGKIVIRDCNANQLVLDENGITITDKWENKVILKEKEIHVVDKSGNGMVMSSGSITINSDSIKLGSDSATEPLVLGNQWLQLFNSHVHVGNLGAPTSPPAAAGTPATPAHLSAKHNAE